MTTIATNGSTIASDGQLTMYERIACTKHKKIFELQDGSFVGICGEIAGIEELIAWLDDPTQPKPERQFEISALLIGRSAEGYVQSITGNCDVIEISAPAAVGTGEAFAIAAMKVGASPKRAVEIACELDIYSSGTVQEFSLK